MESSSSSCKIAQEDSSSTTALYSELVVGMEHSIIPVLVQVPVQEIEPHCSSVIVLAHSDVPVKIRAIVVETEPCSSGVIALLYWDIPVQRAV